ncbi:hypothetical protein K435DRAFT_968425 [Dendrothele bispora CBS 962.96]|uniref:N-acetyltransferase domain-containing protein n=1 Tax=Dendrothele bispora (strain CBS 962.96) TaxID=1314807 RepID=A0A4V4HEF4_DENBC|nr:hypothetical protein K435DRAFT_968425 [Dendrothele bispora CBS 962.96]
MDQTSPNQISPLDHNLALSQSRKYSFSVREITEGELEEVCRIAAQAFLDDAITNFFAGLEEFPNSLSTPGGLRIHHIYSFVVKSCFYIGGRVVVVTASDATTLAKNKSGEKIAGVACWAPPGKRMNVFNIPLTIRCGGLKVLKEVGMSGFKRIILEFMSLTEKTHSKTFRNSLYPGSEVRRKQEKLTPNDAWYLALVMTVKEFEGNGCLSLLMREAYGHAHSLGSTAPFMLESSTPRSRDRYGHLGFEAAPED